MLIYKRLNCPWIFSPAHLDAIRRTVPNNQRETMSFPLTAHATWLETLCSATFENQTLDHMLVSNLQFSTIDVTLNIESSSGVLPLTNPNSQVIWVIYITHVSGFAAMLHNGKCTGRILETRPMDRVQSWYILPLFQHAKWKCLKDFAEAWSKFPTRDTASGVAYVRADTTGWRQDLICHKSEVRTEEGTLTIPGYAFQAFKDWWKKSVIGNLSIFQNDRPVETY